MYNEYDTRWGYGLHLLSISVWCFFVFRFLVFRRLPGLGHDASIRIAFLMMAAGVYVAYLLCRRNYRTLKSIFLAPCVPLGIYTYIALFAYYKGILIGAALVLAAVAGGFALWVLCSPVTHLQWKPVIMKRRQRNCAMMAGLCFTLCAIVALGCGVLTTLRGGYPVKTDDPAQWSIPRGLSLEDNLDVLVDLEQSRWENLNGEQRLELLQLLLKTEWAYLGMPGEPVLYVDDLYDGVLGQTNSITGRITVDIEHLEKDDAAELVDTVLHECRHAYTCQLAKLYRNIEPEYQKLLIFAGVGQFADEYEDYISGVTGDTEAYFMQSVEDDARGYAHYRTNEILDRIDLYLEVTENE